MLLYVKLVYGGFCHPRVAWWIRECVNNVLLGKIHTDSDDKVVSVEKLATPKL